LGSTIGHSFRLTTFGESHGGAVGGVIEGCPPGISLDHEAIRRALNARRTGVSIGASARKEPDEVVWLSGLDEGTTLGTALAFMVVNKDADPASYASFKHLYRPSHADYTYEARYGRRTWAGGGRASARETVSRVIGGCVAQQVLDSLGAVEIIGWVESIGELVGVVDEATVTRAAVNASPVRCPDEAASSKMVAAITLARKEKDSLGGVIRSVARGIPAGLGAPVFDKLDADLAKAMLSIPSVKGFEIGSGFTGTHQRGSQHNDPFVPDGNGGIATSKNDSGGVQGGISNGMEITIRVAFKPVATIFISQDTVDDQGRAAVIEPRGRHDAAVLPRAVPIVEAMMALVLADHWLRWRGQCGP
jgi:chorismate synthase